MMQSVKNLALTMSVKQSTIKGCFFCFFSNQKTCQLSPLNMRESKKKKGGYIQDLLDELNSQTKHQINRLRT